MLTKKELDDIRERASTYRFNKVFAYRDITTLEKQAYSTDIPSLLAHIEELQSQVIKTYEMLEEKLTELEQNGAGKSLTPKGNFHC